MTATTSEPSVAPVYFDAALVAKFYLNEPGRDAVRRLARISGVVVSSGIAVAEVSAAFHRKLREEAVTPAVFKALQGQFVHDVDEGLWKLADPTAALLRDVQASFSRLNRAVFVRSLDAIHLVTAKAEGFERIYSNDRHLLGAAKSFGLEGVNPLSR
ncbi:MAG: type II toxin-antitoxin system VapC family toxin [Vicinamibacteraceae bacterium]